jgi:SAM-dependent MidA family methyltransferase
MRAARLAPEVHFVETSPALRGLQAERFPDATWHDDLATVPEGRPLLVIANEFFDALPVRQLVRTERSWSERLVGWRDQAFVPLAGPSLGSEFVPAHLRSAPLGTVIETSPASVAVVCRLAQMVRASGGAALIIDYGHDRTSPGDTLQAVSQHAFADPWKAPGEQDLTAHVDFEALGAAARAEGVRVHGPVGQGAFLQALGIDARAVTLSRAAPARAEEIEAARARLTAADAMGDLFRVLALVAPGWPEPAGFA